MHDRPPVAGSLSLVGVHGAEVFGEQARRAVARATVTFGSPRHLESGVVPPGGPVRPLGGDLAACLREAARLAASGEHVTVMVSGDPGFFGLTRLAHDVVGSANFAVYPAPSSISLAFAAVGQRWDDASVVSAHGRSLGPVVEAVASQPKVAVLVSPDCPPQAVGRALAERGCGPRRVAVLSHLGDPAQSAWHGDIDGLAAGTFDPISVVVFSAPEAGPGGPGWQWGRPDSSYEHRRGMITKSEVRAVALGKLALPPAGVLWDVGAGSGSVSVESAALAPGLDIYAVERRADDAARIRANCGDARVTVVEGHAPEVLAGLPGPDRVFVGGGGADVLAACAARLAPGGVIVATYAVMDRATSAAALLGNMVQVSVSRAVPVGPEGHLRLAAENPVFVCWGRP